MLLLTFQPYNLGRIPQQTLSVHDGPGKQLEMRRKAYRNAACESLPLQFFL